jgi:RNA polymerase sigma-70 factor (ECF subfamily)
MLKMKSENMTELVSKAVSGDARAFEDLYSAYAKTILFHCRNLIVDKSAYEDVAQEVAIALFTSIGTLKEPKAFGSWLQRIIRNTCINHNKKFMRESESKTVENGEELLSTLPSERPDENPEIGVIEDDTFFGMLDELTPVYRDTLILRYYDELSYGEIAKVLGSTVSTVSTNLIKAKRALERLLNEADRDKENMKAHKIKDLITISANGLIPATACSRFVELASANTLIHVGTAASSGMSLTHTGTVGLKNIIIGVSCGAIAIVGGVGLLIHLNADKWSDENAAATAAAPPAISQSVKTVQYMGTPHIVFANAEGKETRRNISVIRVTENGEISEDVSWSITNESGAEILSGNGETVTIDTDSLANGAYKARFTLMDKQGSIAEISRSFFIDK